jgi:type VI secretion system protein ImpA
MPIEDALLTPIDATSPAGPSLRYTPLYDQINHARREDDDLPRGDWDKARKVADLDQVIRLTRDALAHQSKDLQLAAWWTEAMLRRVGLAGLTDGLTLAAELMERFWDVVHPEIEDGDTDLRAAPLEWMDLKLSDHVRQVPLTYARHDWYDYREWQSRVSGASHGDAGSTQPGTTPQTFDAGVSATSEPFYESLSGEIGSARQALCRLIDVCGRHAFSGPAPTFPELTAALDSLDQVVTSILRSKREGAIALDEQRDASAPASGIAAILVYAASARATDPASPLPYLLVRAVQWGTLDGQALLNGSLDGPKLEARKRLALLHRESRWPELLEAAETELAASSGRAWLDLQRYTAAACDALGNSYTVVREAVLGETRVLLSRFPSLPAATLSDGSAAADAATHEWVKRLLSAASCGIESDDRSARARFLARLRLARECVANGQARVGCAVAEELLVEIERRQLDQWESPDLLLEPLLLLLESSTDIERRRALFNRICRLNPQVAIARKLDPDG